MKSIVTYAYTMGVGGGIESTICDVSKDIMTAEDARLLEMDIAWQSKYDKIIILCCTPLSEGNHKDGRIEIAGLIGIPALLEQCAEECSELSKACLKYARKLRKENPTPTGWTEIIGNLTEEICDVRICIEEIMKSSIYSGQDPGVFTDIMAMKKQRWANRVKEGAESE